MILAKEEIIKNSIKSFLNELDDYSFEVIITDMWCLYNGICNNTNFEKIYITKKVGDFEIDSILLSNDYNNIKELSLLQISKSSKKFSQLKKFSDKKYLEKYSDIIDEDYQNEKRILITLKKSEIINPNIEVIHSENLINLIYKTGIYYNLFDDSGNFIKNYINNIELRTELWELINIYRKKKKKCIVNNYLNILMINHKLIQQNIFTLLSSMNIITDEKMKEILDYITSGNYNENYKFIIMSKFELVSEISFAKYKNDVEQLVKFLLNYINYNLSKYEIVPRCSYLALKNRSKNSVIAYFNYGYNNKKTKSFKFGFKCLMEDISEEFKYNSNIEDTTQNKEFSDSSSFKTPILLTNPDLINDSALIKELLIKSEERISKKNNIPLIK